MKRSFVVDNLPVAVSRYRHTHVLVVADVFRATTTLLTALAAGREVYVARSVDEAHQLAAAVPDALLLGEQAGDQPQGFDMNNSPSLLEGMDDRRPVVVLSSSGTPLLVEAALAPAAYALCLRNLTATAEHLVELDGPFALIGAGTRGAPRAEDQMACARLGRKLMDLGCTPADENAAREVESWSGQPLGALRDGPSAGYLRRSQQEVDIDFVLSHLDDLALVARVDGNRVHAPTAGRPLAGRSG